MTLFPLRNGHQSITLVCEIISVWKGRSRKIPSKGEYSLTVIFLLSSWSKCLVRQPTQTNFVLRLAARPWLLANMWPVACWRPAAEPLLAACWPPTAGSVDRAAGCINSLRIAFSTLHQVSSLHQVFATCTGCIRCPVVFCFRQPTHGCHVGCLSSLSSHCSCPEATRR